MGRRSRDTQGVEDLSECMPEGGGDEEEMIAGQGQGGRTGAAAAGRQRLDLGLDLRLLLGLE